MKTKSKKQPDPMEAAEEILETIDKHPFSLPGVPRSVSRAFWEEIQEGLRARLEALGSDEGAD